MGFFKGRRSHAEQGTYDQNRHSHATAWVFALGLDYDLNNNWTIGVSAKFQDWKAHKHSRIYNADLEYVNLPNDVKAKGHNDGVLCYQPDIRSRFLIPP